MTQALPKAKAQTGTKKSSNHKHPDQYRCEGRRVNEGKYHQNEEEKEIKKPKHAAACHGNPPTFATVVPKSKGTTYANLGGYPIEGEGNPRADQLRQLWISGDGRSLWPC
jgi:hypothetical protein